MLDFKKLSLRNIATGRINTSNSIIRTYELLTEFKEFLESYEPSCSMYFAQYFVVIIHIACYNCLVSTFNIVHLLTYILSNSLAT